MINRYFFVRLPVFSGVCALVLLLIASCYLPGCAPAPAEEQPSQPVRIYDDGVYMVELMDRERVDDGQGGCMELLSLRFANNSLEDVALSSVLGMKVTADGQPCELVSVEKTETRQPLDGLVPSGDSREGCVMVKMPVESDGFTVEIAADYLDDLWISFDVSL